MAYTCEIIAALLPNYLGDFASTFTAFPPMAIPGLLASVAALRSKQTLVLAARSAAELGQIGVEHVYAPPALVDRLCDGQQPSARLRLLSTAGSIVTGGTASRWSGYFQELRIAYGSYEAGVCGFADLTTLSERQDSAQLAYQLLPGVHAEVVDKNDICLPPQSEGILRLKTPWMVSGYIDAPEDSAQTFRDGWYYPGDLAVLDADGLLTITGRLKDQLNFGGVKVSGDILDAAIRKADGLADGIAFALQQPHGPDIFCVLAVLASGAEPTQVAARVRRACSSLGPRVLVPRHIYFVESLPLSERGKVMRNAAAAASLSAAPF
jgi:acyl-coenzyme A synthetase/AMP-(fatty) acid ligase